MVRPNGHRRHDEQSEYKGGEWRRAHQLVLAPGGTIRFHLTRLYLIIPAALKLDRMPFWNAERFFLWYRHAAG